MLVAVALVLGGIGCRGKGKIVVVPRDPPKAAEGTEFFEVTPEQLEEAKERLRSFGDLVDPDAPEEEDEPGSDVPGS